MTWRYSLIGLKLSIYKLSTTNIQGNKTETNPNSIQIHKI